MTTPRLRSDIVARALLRQCGQDGRSAMLLKRGDADAGGILVVLLGREDKAVVLSQTRTAAGDAAWLKSSGDTPLSAEKTQTYLDRQLRYDPDLWVLEVEAPDFRPPFEATLL
ncbi:DUF1491 family protein [Acetobacter orleanensis]|uniref:DUF1491 family protein n=1 Tax=Acetobacter orleanensis TaxID=104099 RepID=A0A4Y3TKQ3_9PROT|nr:DUF1491 family protein [Acetobacter orleanensis]KXV62860.1 hypothetical protein AD949_08880 [Acetobacter orleanensis]PCD80636.1 DUF1491 domain-containing protein [Acetobacter orleanensis]GAN68028.1 hypothetical protein Abol_014_079 [Acetobacter orleanensis JCM 7639]GBR27295.1 hypothetical protein AA0473_1394 [Acetobacter orleanensis NRIC 0473]GEB82049.1 hypothetical protein AOR01nite_05260 [Acetobacter orleanensis]